MRSFILLLLLLAPAFAAGPAANTPNVAPSAALEVHGTVDGLVLLPTVDGAQWCLGCELPIKFWPDGPVCRVSAATPGRYLILATSPAGVQRFAVVIDPPAPMPGPGPVTPPGPVPPAPAPDALTKALSEAFAADTGATKKADALKLASLYKAGATAATNPKILTAQQLLDAVRNAGTSMTDPLSATALPITRKAFGAALKGIVGEDLKAPLAKRDEVAAMFLKAESILEGLGK